MTEPFSIGIMVPLVLGLTRSEKIVVEAKKVSYKYNLLCMGWEDIRCSTAWPKLEITLKSLMIGYTIEKNLLIGKSGWLLCHIMGHGHNAYCAPYN